MKRLLALSTAVAVALTAAACSGKSDSPSSTDGAVTLRVGVLGTANTQEALLKAAGQLDGLPGYKIEWSLFPAGPQLVEAEKAGAVDIGLTATTPAIFAQAAGTPIKIVAAYQLKDATKSAQAILVPKDSPIKSVAELKGKKVALTNGTILQYLTIKALGKNGLGYKDITPVDLPVTDAFAAFKRGDVDAWTTIDPYVTQAVAQTGARVLVSGAGLQVDGWVQLARQKALDDPKTAEAIADYVKRINTAQVWQQSNLDTWAGTYATLNKIPEPLAKQLLINSGYVPVKIDQTVIAAQQNQADAYQGLGLLPKKLNVAAEFDNRFDSLAVAP
ncbi:ABC transporter substrate-binding protein [Actinocorallia lasiicapitis]